ncbi:hypothetical protein [Streptomyces sp. NBC_00076]|uniref:hypothetical protein n=1 Tax=Streptomyces sp. NBC_00076 TaxID=2975642 RepID=UPI003255657C
MERVTELTRENWQGVWNSWRGFHSFDGKMPIVATTLELLREHGPAGPAFQRFGRERYQNLWDAIGNPRAGMPPWPTAPKTDGAAERRKQPNARPSARYAPTAGPSSPTTGGTPAPGSTGAARTATCTCATTTHRALEAERKAEQAERGRQELERQEAEAVQAAKVGGRLSRFRPDPGRSAAGASPGRRH